MRSVLFVTFALTPPHQELLHERFDLVHAPDHGALQACEGNPPEN